MLEEEEIRRRLKKIMEGLDHTSATYPYYLGIVRGYKDVLEIDENGTPYLKVVDGIIVGLEGDKIV